MADTNITIPDSFIFNGLDAVSGSYLLPEMSTTQLSQIAQGLTLDPNSLAELKQRKFDLENPHAGVEADARQLAETGWGVIFAHDASPAIQDALASLLALRKDQAGDRFKIYAGGDGYRPGESKNDFLKRHKMGPGPVNPDRVPYYLLIVGDPTKIPYRFQYQMDVQYAVGRIHFETLQEYASYAQSVVTAETGLQLPPQAAFFGVANPDDRATNMSYEHLVQPLAAKLGQEAMQWVNQAPGTTTPEWHIQSMLKEEATKARLSELLNGPKPPAVLFSASHGIGFPNGDNRQIGQQGALICQDWPGPLNWRGGIKEDFYFSGDDLITTEANLLGSLAFFFACYGAGTPHQDEFAHQLYGDQAEQKVIAPHDFIARLPQRMLSLPKGGALAVVGHVERAWGVSFYWGEAGAQFQAFEDCFERLLKGNFPIGYAVEVFNNRYAELASDLSNELDEIRHFGKQPNDRALAQMWTANNDARNYIVLGDPAVRLAVGGSAKPSGERPVIPEISIQPQQASIETSTAAIQPSTTTTTPVHDDQTAIDYGLMDSFRQAQTSVGSALEKFVDKLGAFLSSALDEATSLEVATYVSSDMSTVQYSNGRFSGATLPRPDPD